MTHKINPNTVTHIKLHPLTEGVLFYLGGHRKYKWLPERKNRWFTSVTDYPEGWYRNGKYADPSWYKIDLKDYPQSVTVIDGSLFSLPMIEIFAGSKNIATKYFETYKQATDWWQENLPNVSIEI